MKKSLESRDKRKRGDDENESDKQYTVHLIKSSEKVIRGTKGCQWGLEYSGEKKVIVDCVQVTTSAFWGERIEFSYFKPNERD